MDLPVTLQATNQQPLTATAFAEAAHALSRINELRWVRPGDARSAPFTLGAIARTFLEGPGAVARPERRVFTAAFASLAPGAPEGAEEEVAVALAKHYNDSYRVSRDADVACQVVRPFDGIRQATAREGCAVVVRTEADSPDFIQQYYTRAFQPAYLPFALLAVHETEAWRDLARGLARWHEIDTERSRATAVAALRACRTEAVQLRLAFGFNQVSAVASHSRWRNALDDVLELPRTRRQISEEVTAAELLIAEQHSRTTERNTRWISIIAGAGVTCATAFSVLKDVLLPSFGKEDWPLRWGLVLEPSATLAALLSVILGGVAGTLIWWRLGRYDPPDVSTADRVDDR